jgi:hypothetical protein
MPRIPRDQRSPYYFAKDRPVKNRPPAEAVDCQPHQRHGDRGSTNDDDGSADDRYLNVADIRARYSVSDMWIFRRLHDSSEFPAPAMIIRTRRFWLLSDLVAWERRCAKGTGKAA